jgi:hypothetical protein
VIGGTGSHPLAFALTELCSGVTFCRIHHLINSLSQGIRQFGEITPTGAI